MSVWNAFKTALASARSRAKTEAAQAAARSVARSTQEAVERLGEDVLGDAEAALERATLAREGREDVRPDSSEADAIAARIEALARGED